MSCNPTLPTYSPAQLNTDPSYLDEGEDGKKPVIYQMMTRLFGNQLQVNKPYGTLEENGVGTFNAINDTALAALKDLGVTHVWYTGVIEHATMTDYSADSITYDDPDVIKGRAGSPYAIKDYYDVNPDLAVQVDQRMKEFEALVGRTHDQGMKVLLDFVPNHVARRYHSDAKPEGIVDLGTNDDVTKAFSPQNNFYYLPGEAFVVPPEYNPLGAELKVKAENNRFEEFPAKASGNDVFSAQPSVNDWFETVKLNYGVDYQNDRITHFDPIPDTWEKMYQILAYWTEKGVDGFRCDMAEMVPAAFWNWVIPKVKQRNPDLVFIAEIYTPASYERYTDFGKFDFLYDKVQLYDTLKHIMQERGSTHHLPAIWQSLRGRNKNMLRFLENHDEQRIASPDFAGNPEKALPAMLVSATIYAGPVMVYFGQEVGEPGAGIAGFSGEDGRTTIFDYWGVPEHQKWVNSGAFDGGQLNDAQKELRKFYRELLNFSTQQEAIVKGKLYDLQEANKNQPGYTDKVYSYLRFTDQQVLLFLTNFDAHKAASFQLQLPASVLNALGRSASLPLNGKFGTTETLNYEGGVVLTLPPLAAYVFEL